MELTTEFLPPEKSLLKHWPAWAPLWASVFVTLVNLGEQFLRLSENSSFETEGKMMLVRAKEEQNKAH